MYQSSPNQTVGKKLAVCVLYWVCTVIVVVHWVYYRYIQLRASDNSSSYTKGFVIMDIQAECIHAYLIEENIFSVQRWTFKILQHSLCVW